MISDAKKAEMRRQIAEADHVTWKRVDLLSLLDENERLREESERLRAVIFGEHRHKPDDGCRAMTDPSGTKPPGPPSPPVSCTLRAGHAGQHRTMYGGSVPEPIVLRDPGPGWCAKCNVRWPCDIARAALSATKPDIEAAAQWLMDDDTSYAAEPDFARRAARHMLAAALKSREESR